MADEKKEPKPLGKVLDLIDNLVDSGKEPKKDLAEFIQEITRVLDSVSPPLDEEERKSIRDNAMDYLKEAEEGFPMGKILKDYFATRSEDLPPSSLLQYAHDNGWSWEAFCTKHKAFSKAALAFKAYALANRGSPPSSKRRGRRAHA